MRQAFATDKVQQAGYTAFQDQRRLASGTLREVVAAALESIEGSSQSPLIIFDDSTARTVEVDFRGAKDEVLGRVEAREAWAAREAERAKAVEAGRTGAGEAERAKTAEAGRTDGGEAEKERGPGRPRLGVVAREVTLLPRHWEWLSAQPGGASVALRKLVEEARRTHQARDRARLSQEAVHRFMTVMAGDFPGYQEASRAFYRGDRARFDQLTEPWPQDIREYLAKLVDRAMQDKAEADAEAKIG